MVQKKQNWAKSLTMAVNLATNVAAVIGIGLFGGMWLDKRFIAYDPETFFTNNLFTILGFMLGAASAMKMMWDKLMEQERKEFSTGEKPDQDQK